MHPGKAATRSPRQDSRHPALCQGVPATGSWQGSLPRAFRGGRALLALRLQTVCLQNCERAIPVVSEAAGLHYAPQQSQELTHHFWPLHCEGPGHSPSRPQAACSRASLLRPRPSAAGKGCLSNPSEPLTSADRFPQQSQLPQIRRTTLLVASEAVCHPAPSPLHTRTTTRPLRLLGHVKRVAHRVPGQSLLCPDCPGHSLPPSSLRSKAAFSGGLPHTPTPPANHPPPAPQHTAFPPRT